MAKTAISIKLTPQEDRELRLIVRRQKVPYQDIVRASIILYLSKGVNPTDTARTVGVARRIVYKWAKRFLDKRMEGLEDRPRPGRPALFSPDRGVLPDEAGLRAP
jgi:transposase